MNKYLNIGLMQYEIEETVHENLDKIRQNIELLMKNLNPPEVIFAPELGLGLLQTDTIPGKTTDALCEIAKEYGIYLLAGSLYETETVDGKKHIYNTTPIIGPDGKLISKYRKMCPYYPDEYDVTPGDEYVILDIKEKNIKIGVMNCHDWCFPEISRNLSLLGAEILYRPAIDPEGLYDAFKYFPSVRALENQAYFISLNAVGKDAYGHSIVADPEGKIIYEAGCKETNCCLTLDVGKVVKTRVYGAFYTEQLMRQLKLFNLPMPFANNIGGAPIFKDLPNADITIEERLEHVKELGLNTSLGTVDK